MTTGDFWEDAEAFFGLYGEPGELDELGGFDEDAPEVAHHPACDKYGDDSQCDRCNH